MENTFLYPLSLLLYLFLFKLLIKANLLKLVHSYSKTILANPSDFQSPFRKQKCSSAWMRIFSKLKSIVWLRRNVGTAPKTFLTLVEGSLNPLSSSSLALLFSFLLPDGVSWSLFCRFQDALFLSLLLQLFREFSTLRVPLEIATLVCV